MTYIPKIGDRVEWASYGHGQHTVIAVGEQCAMVVDESGEEFAAFFSRLIPIPDTVTIEISREDAEELVRVVEERDDIKSWLHGTSWTFASELRLKAKLQAALRGEK